MLQIGDKIPSFHAVDMEGKSFTESDLKGKVTVIYFYPKDETPGCTKEACEFRDGMQEIRDLGAIIVGVSPDSVSSHKNFQNNHKLNFTLLSDEKMDVFQKFGVIQKKEEKVGIVRTTFIVDANGIIRWLESPVNVENHVERVTNAVEEIIKGKKK